MSVSSAQKQLSEVFHQYAKSVSKTAAVSSNRPFFFTEEVSFENLDAESKSNIIFGQKTSNYLGLPPPGKLGAYFGPGPSEPQTSHCEETKLRRPFDRQQQQNGQNQDDEHQRGQETRHCRRGEEEAGDFG
jgi:hypothetical protein